METKIIFFYELGKEGDFSKEMRWDEILKNFNRLLLFITPLERTKERRRKERLRGATKRPVTPRQKDHYEKKIKQQLSRAKEEWKRGRCGRRGRGRGNGLRCRGKDS